MFTDGRRVAHPGTAARAVWLEPQTVHVVLVNVAQDAHLHPEAKDVVLFRAHAPHRVLVVSDGFVGLELKRAEPAMTSSAKNRGPGTSTVWGRRTLG
eukprot:2068712-Pyramimonas_sp.AAC.1